MRLTTLLPLLLAVALPAQQPTFPLTSIRPDAPLVCSHRGRLTSADLENSVSTMRRTFAAGIPMMEFDTRESASGTIFLSHDNTLDRNTNGTGTVASHTDAELAKISLLDPTTHAPVEPLNRFDDLLAWARTSGVALMVDLKDAPPADVVASLRRFGLIDHSVLLAFDPKTTAFALASDPAVPVSILVHSPQEIDAAIAQAHGHPIVFYIANTANPSLFVYAHKTGHAILSDAMNDLDPLAAEQGPSAYRDLLATRPIDILVTDRALQLRAATTK